MIDEKSSNKQCETSIKVIDRSNRAKFTDISPKTLKKQFFKLVTLGSNLLLFFLTLVASGKRIPHHAFTSSFILVVQITVIKL